MRWRTRRQLTVVMGTVGIAGALVLWVFLRVYFTPTCFDDLRNQGEEDVDCGGSCVSCEVKHAVSPELFFARGIAVRQGVYDLVAQIKNLNEAVAARRMDYEFTLSDGAGEIVRKQGYTFLYPQEQLHIVEAGVEAGRPPMRVDFKIFNILWHRTGDARPNFVVERRDYRVRKENGRFESLVEAMVLNRSSLDFREVEVNFTVLDREGNIVGVNRVVMENFLAGSRRGVISIWPREFVGEVTTIGVEPRADIFDGFNIIKPQ